jgi:hypothetical protein
MHSANTSLNLYRSDLLLFSLLSTNTMPPPNHFNHLTPHLNGKTSLSTPSYLTSISFVTLDKTFNTTRGPLLLAA